MANSSDAYTAPVHAMDGERLLEAPKTQIEILVLVQFRLLK